MRLYKKNPDSLRVYLEGSSSEISKLYYSFSSKFYKEPNEYTRDNEDDISNIIFEEDGEYHFPLGLINLVVGELDKLSIPYILNVEDSLPPSSEDFNISEDILEGITLREYQIEGVKKALSSKRGILNLATGAGKSELMIAIAKYLLENLDKNILICVPTANLLHQTYDRMISRGISNNDISKYGDGNKIDISKRIVVSTVQSAYRRLDDKEFKSWYSNICCIMLDEAQHSACRTWYTLIDRLHPEYIIGVSAEPFYGDAEHLARDLILRGIVGPILYRIPMNYLIDRGYLSKPYVIAIDSKYNGNIHKVINWQTVNKLGIVQNSNRNSSIKDIALELISINKNPLILVQQISHGCTLAELISSEGIRVAVLTGGMKVSIYLNGREVDSYKDSENRVKDDFQEGLYDVLIGTSVLDEGADIPALSSVILAGGSKSKLKLIQRLGRGLRRKEGDNSTFIIDFQDRFNIVLHSHHKKRKTLFIENNIPIYYCNDLDNISSFFSTIIKERMKEVSSQNF